MKLQNHFLMILFIGGIMLHAQTGEKIVKNIKIYSKFGDSELKIFPNSNNEIDIDGVIRFEFDKEQIARALNERNEETNFRAIEYNKKIKYVQEFLKLIDDLSSKGKIFLSGNMKDGEEWESFKAAGSNFYKNFFSYIDSIAGGKEIRANFNRMLGTPGEGRTAALKYFSTIMQEELIKLNKLIPSISEADNKISFQIVGQLITEKSSRLLNIPGYFTAETDFPTTYQKVKYSLSKEEMEAIQNQEKLITSLAQTKGNFEAIKTQLKEEMDKVIDSFKAIENKIVGISTNQLNTISSLKIDSNQEAINNVITHSKMIVSGSSELVALVKEKYKSYESNAENIFSSNNQTAASAMFSILGTAQSIAEDINNVSTRIKSIAKSSMNALTDIEKFRSTDIEEITKAAKNSQVDLELYSVKNILEEMQNIPGEFKESILGKLWITLSDPIKANSIKESISASIDLTPDLVDKLQKHTQDDLVDTNINLEEYKDRKPGDYVKIKILVTQETSISTIKKSSSLLDTEYLIKLCPLGASSDLHTGLVFVNKNTDNGEYYPTVAVSWTLKYLPITKGCWRDIISTMGIGFHTTTLVVDQKNTQIGIGPSIHFFNNLVQAGIGWNLGTRGIPYFYFGLGIIDLLNKIK